MQNVTPDVSEHPLAVRGIQLNRWCTCRAFMPVVGTNLVESVCNEASKS